MNQPTNPHPLRRAADLVGEAVSGVDFWPGHHAVSDWFGLVACVMLCVIGVAIGLTITQIRLPE
jgi:hypothetical protein